MKFTTGLIAYWLLVGSMIGLTVWSCGRDRYIIQEGNGSGGEGDPLPSPNPGGNIPDSPPTWSEVKTIVDRDCKPCHSEPFVQSEAGFKSGRPEARIKAGTMPPPNSSQASTFNQVKDRVLEYLDQ